MAEAAPDIESAADRFQETLDALTASVESFEQLNGRMEESLPLLGDQLEEFDGQLESLSVMSEDLQARLEESGGEVATEMEQWTAAVEGTQETFESAGSSLVTTAESLHEATAKAAEVVQSAEGDVSGHLTERHEQVAQITADYDETTQSLEQLFEEVKGAVETHNSELIAAVEEAGGAAQQFSTVLAESLAPEFQQKIDDALAAIEERLAQEVEQGIGQADGALTQLAETFDAQAEEIAQEMSGQIQEMMEEFAEYARTRVAEEVTEKIEELISEIVEAFAAEIVMSITTTTAGTSITGSMSPVLPQLVIAKKALEIINRFL